ncbi:MAG: lysozyme [Hyphomonas sp.]
MALSMRTSDAGVELIKSFEGFRARAARLPSGKWIIGHGHTDGAREGLRVSRADAGLLLRHHDLRRIEQLIETRILAPLNQNEFDALVSFAFNLGEDAFLGSSVFTLLNSGERLQAADAMTAWRKGRVDGEIRVIDALVRRRAAEKALFLEHPSGRIPVPGALIRPEFDPHAAWMVSPERPVVIEARTEGDRTKAARADDGDSAPQAAARAVSERISRILEAEDRAPPAPVADNDEPTVDEITKAVSALAEPEGPAAQADHTEVYDRRRTARVAPPLPSPPVSLAETAPPPASPAWADLDSGPNEFDFEAAPLGLVRWLPYALLAGLGSWGIIDGVRRWIETGPAAELARPEKAYVGPIEAFGAAMICVISVYYLYRAINSRD